MVYLMSLVMIVGLLIAAERYIALHKGKIRSGDFVAGIVNLLRKGRTVEALSLCEDTPGPVAAIVKVGLLNIRRSSAELTLALQSAAAAEVPLLEKRVNSLLFFSRVAQLVGLMGAILALKTPFDALAGGSAIISTQAFGAAMAGALAWVAVGLGTGVVFYATYQILNGRVRALVAEMERAAIELQSQMSHNASQTTPAT